MYMDYKRLFLNWIKQKDPQNIFEFYLQRNNQTLKSHVKMASDYDHLILFNSFSWLDTSVGFYYWDHLYYDWIKFYKKWIQNHQKNTSYEL